MKKVALAAFVAMCIGSTALAQQSTRQPGQPSAEQPRQQQPSRAEPRAQAPRGGDRTEQVSFEQADQNRDGMVNREEADDIDGFMAGYIVIAPVGPVPG